MGVDPHLVGDGSDEGSAHESDDFGDESEEWPDEGDAVPGVVRVLPDQTGLTKTFDYLVPEEWRDRVTVGTRVRIALGPRRVGGWVVDTEVRPDTVHSLRPIAKLSGRGPDAELVDLARWAAWRWAARTPVPFLRTASPERVVDSIPRPGGSTAPVPEVDDPSVAEAFEGGLRLLRLGPVEDLYPVALAAAARGDALIVCPARGQARYLAARLRRAGVNVAVHPDDWARAAAGGCTVVGTRAAAWAPVPHLAAVVVFDEHDEVHQEERSPTWSARDVAVERARRAGVPCVLTSPCPSLESLEAATLVRVDRGRERAAWPAAVVVDRFDEDTGRNALFSPALTRVVREGGRVVAVLNQKGRAALLACARCRAVARCDRCQAAVHSRTDTLVCRRCGQERPMVCGACGGMHLRTVRLGVSRVRDDLEALTGEPVVEVTADTPESEIDGRLFVGTEAVLHRVPTADVVAFLDFDQELFAPRYRAAEEALALLVLAARMVGGRASGGRILIQTTDPEHEVCRAAVTGDPSLVEAAERIRRAELGFPPYRALAEVADQAASAFVDRIPAAAGLSIKGPVDGSWQVWAPNHRTLCDGLAGVERPSGRLRLSVDPPRV